MDDLISRQAALDGKISIQRVDGLEIYSDEAVPVEYLKRLPSAQPERKKGKWVMEHYVWFCSECGENPTKGMGYVQGHDELYDFCPNCGAAMNQEVKE